MKSDNKIGIPWYRRTVSKVGELNDMGSTPISFDLPSRKPKSESRVRRQPIRQPATQPVQQPATSPVKVPYPTLQPDFDPKPFPFPNPFPTPFPLPNQKPNTKPETPSLPALPSLPVWATNPNYDWTTHWQQVAANTPVIADSSNPAQKAFEMLIKPLLTFMLLNEAKNQLIEVNITDPIYKEMLKDPVLGQVLREAEKSNMDAQTVGTYFANYDWDNFDAEQMGKDLTMLVGAAGAARLLVFIIGRRVLFRV